MLFSVLVGAAIGMDIYCVNANDKLYAQIKKKLQENGYVFDESVPCEFINKQKRTAYIPIINILDLYMQSKSASLGLLEGIYKRELIKCGRIEYVANEDSEKIDTKPHDTSEINGNDDVITKTNQEVMRFPSYVDISGVCPVKPRYTQPENREIIVHLPSNDESDRHFMVNVPLFSKYYEAFSNLRDMQGRIDLVNDGDKTHINFHESVNPTIIQSFIIGLTPYGDEINTEYQNRF